MNNAFRDATSFNQNIGSWNVANVTTMNNMFNGASSFNQDLPNWDISSVTTMVRMLTNSGLDITNYDNTLLGWSTQTVQSNVRLGADGLQYCLGEPGRDILVANGWIISGDELSCGEPDLAFVTTWETTTTNESIEIPVRGNGLNFDIDWGDGQMSTGLTATTTHTYAAPGVHTVTIYGNFGRLFIANNASNRDKILSIEQWGSNEWTGMLRAFQGASNLVSNATDVPTIIGRDIRFAFQFATNFDADLGGWDISGVRSMAHALSESGLSQTNYDNTLIGWSAQSVQSNVTFGAENLIYCAAVAERNSLITNNGWNIRGDSQCASTRQSDDSVEIVEITENEVFEFSNFEKVSVYPVPTGGELTLTYLSLIHISEPTRPY